MNDGYIGPSLWVGDVMMDECYENNARSLPGIETGTICVAGENATDCATVDGR